MLIYNNIFFPELCFFWGGLSVFLKNLSALAIFEGVLCVFLLG